jgi:hypothetical protein
MFFPFSTVLEKAQLEYAPTTTLITTWSEGRYLSEFGRLLICGLATNELSSCANQLRKSPGLKRRIQNARNSERMHLRGRDKRSRRHVLRVSQQNA